MNPKEIEKYIFLKNCLSAYVEYKLSFVFFEALEDEWDCLLEDIGERVIEDYEKSLEQPRGACY
jgi:hypothetical protein